MAGVVLAFREIILLSNIHSWMALLPIGVYAPIIALLGYLVYGKLQKGFADVV